ncbi:MAG: T9SS type A sorting domain-containing protein [Bacteroidetes bacterium]|nr:T9SS type A sorting domain-containing protein [Bacteroidota bacterium]
MKKNLLLILAMIVMTNLFAGQWTSIRSQVPTQARTELISSDISTSIIHFSLDGYFLNPVNTPHGTEYTVSVDNSTHILQKGAPDLPKLTASVIIPDMALMNLEVVSSSYTDFENVSIAPSKGNLMRDIDPSTIPFEYGRAYSQDAFFPTSSAELRDPFILRDYRGQTIIANPFVYNPVTRILRVYSDITVRVFQSGTSQFNAFNRSSMPGRIDHDFGQVYSHQFLNTVQADYTPVNDYGRMLIICYGQFMQAMQPFVNWKNAMGIQTEIVDVATVGNSADAIKAYVANYYNTHGLTFLMLIGDAPQIPTNTTGSLGGPSDNAYGYLVGNDHYPDIFVGRFSAETVDHVNTMVQRTLEYEQNPVLTPNWMPSGIGIGSDQGPGDDNEYDYQHIRNIRTKLMGFTYTDVAELYDGSQGGEDASGNPTPAMVSAEINAGASIINYCGHGSQTSWGTTGFSNSNVNQLSNNHMWPFILSVACVNGDFVSGTCFAEAWLRAKNAEGPTGAVATVMSTINQSWDPPMDGQDEMDDLLVGTYPDNIKRTFGGLTMNGCCQMNDDFGTDGANMTDTWTIFGDPSLLVRTAMPTAMVVSHEAQVFLGTSSFTVNVDTEGALVGLTVNGQFLGSAFVINGSATITFPAFQTPDSLHIVVTAFNKIPYQADIAIIPNNGPYLIYNNNLIHDAAYNNNGLADYGETVTLDLALTNIGVLPANNVSVTIQSADPFITITDATENYSAIAAGDTTVVTDGFAFEISAAIPDQHTIPFQYSATNGTDTWTGSFTITAHAGVLKYSSFTISDPNGNNNGKADPGETFDLLVKITNSGTADLTNVTGQISFNDPYVSLLSSPAQAYDNIAPGITVQRSFTITADPLTPSGHVVPAAFLMTADLGLNLTSALNLVIGQIPVAVIDLDGNLNSGPLMLNALNANNVFAEYKNVLPADLSGYKTLFVCLGTNDKKHVLTNPEGQQLTDFLNNGGRLYMEGGDTWYYDPKTPVHPLFKASGVTDGGNDLSIENGMPGTFADSLSFAFTGDNEYIDHIVALTPAFSLFKNATPAYYSAVAYDQGTYKTIASSFEFGGLSNAAFPSTRNEYMRRIIEFFGILSTQLTANFMGNPVNICDGGSVTFQDFSTGGAISWNWTFPGGVPGSSNEAEPTVVYNNPGLYDVTLIISNGTTTDTLIKTAYVWVEYCTGVKTENAGNLTIYPNPASASATINFGAMKGMGVLTVADATGRIVYTDRSVSLESPYVMKLNGIPAGIYFLTTSTSTGSFVGKLVVR